MKNPFARSPVSMDNHAAKVKGKKTQVISRIAQSITRKKHSDEPLNVINLRAQINANIRPLIPILKAEIDNSRRSCRWEFDHAEVHVITMGTEPEIRCAVFVGYSSKCEKVAESEPAVSTALALKKMLDLTQTMFDERIDMVGTTDGQNNDDRNTWPAAQIVFPDFQDTPELNGHSSVGGASNDSGVAEMDQN